MPGPSSKACLFISKIRGWGCEKEDPFIKEIINSYRQITRKLQLKMIGHKAEFIHVVEVTG